MDKNNLKSLLEQAEEMEKKYEWLQATEYYKKASGLVLDKKDFSEAGTFFRRMAFSYFKSAFQSKTNNQFKERLSRAIKTYEKAITFLHNSPNQEDVLQIYDAKAMIAYSSSWSEFDIPKKKKFLDEWWSLKLKVLRTSEKFDNKLAMAKTINDMMEGSNDFRYWFVTSWEEAKQLRFELISFGEQAIKILTEINDEYELARSYCWTSWYCLQSNTKPYDEGKDLAQKGLNYSKKALKLIEKIEDAWLIGWTNLSASRAANQENAFDSTTNFIKNQIKYGEIAKDNYLSGHGRWFLVIVNLVSGYGEEDPDKRRERYNHNIEIAKEALRQFKVINLRTWNAYHPITTAYRMLADIEPDIQMKYDLLKKAVYTGKKAKQLTQGWMYSAIPVIINSHTHVLYRLSKIEVNPIERRRLLEEILKNTKENTKILEAFPRNYGVKFENQAYSSLAKADLSTITLKRKNKINLLEDSVESIEICKKYLKRELETNSLFWVYGLYASFYYDFGRIYHQYYSLTKNKSLLRKAIEAYDEAISLFGKLKLMTRIAESIWQKAKIQDQLGEYSKAAKDYDSASHAYLRASQKIPQLKEFYNNYSFYMQAWNQIEQARYNHSKENYTQAVKHYEEAAFLHEQSKFWNYLGSNYYAWVQLEKAEHLSRKEEPSKSIKNFELAKECFKKSKHSIKKKSKTLESIEEKDLASNLIKDYDLRFRYCNSRISLEEAKIFDRTGNYELSSNRYRTTADILDKIIDELESEEEKRELRLIMVLSKAWEQMALAEGKKSAEYFLEASQLFENAKDISKTEKTSLWTLGNSSFCKGLAAENQFQATFDMSYHSMANKYVKQAGNYYKQAGYKKASEYAKATQRLFDAYLYMNSAEDEIDPDKKTKYYQLTEQLLQIAVDLFSKAEQPDKVAKVQSILTTVQEEKALAASLNEVMHAPSVASTTMSFTAPTSTSEASVGLESFEHANVQANLISTVEDVKIGESFCLSVEFVNAGREPALLMKVEDFVPPDFVVVKKPEIYRIEETTLNMKGKQLAPLKLVEVKLTLQPSKKGEYRLNPKIHYLDEMGQNKSLQLKTLEIKVEEILLDDRVSTGTQELDSLLLGGIPKEYAVVLSAPPCDEREMIVENFLKAGVEDGISFYVSTEATGLEDLLQKPNFYLFLCNPKPKVEVPDLPNVYKLQGKADMNNLSIALIRAIRNIDQSVTKRRICVEILSDVLMSHGPKTTREWLSGLITDLGAKGFTLLAVIDPTMHSSEHANAVINLFDGEISIIQSDDPLDCKKSLRVKKLRNCDYLKNPICLR